MSWPSDIGDELPAPRDDEPPELRRDIADELADHLACALNREIHRTGDETRARENVIDRFGDPIQIARRLWLDALKEKIMSQRIVVIAAVLLVLAGFTSTGLTWVIIRQTREVNEQLLAESRRAAEQSRDANLALLQQLGEFTNRPPAEAAAPKSLEWNPVKIRLVSGQSGGPPAVDCTVRLRGYLLDTAKEITVDRKTGDDGVADFGLVRPGQHHFIVTTPWEESLGILSSSLAARAGQRGSNSSRTTEKFHQLTVLPGESIVHDVVCPAAPRKETKIALSLDWPDDLREKNLWAVCSLQLLPRETGGHDWTSPPDQEYQVVMLGPSGQFLHVTYPLNPYFLGKPSQFRRSVAQNLLEHRGGRFGSVIIPGVVETSAAFSDGLRRTHAGTRYALVIPRCEPSQTMQCAVGDYQLQKLAVLQPAIDSPETVSEQIVTYPLLFGMERSESPGSSSRRELIEGSFATWQGLISGAGFSNRAEPLADEREFPLLEAREETENVWRLPFPAALADRVRESLAPPDQPGTRPKF